MANLTFEGLSEFGQAALTLDGEFTKFDRLAQEIERLAVTSDKGLARAETLLVEIDACRSRLGAGMQSFARILEAARERCDKAAQVVADRAVEVQARQKEVESLLFKFQALGEMVREITVSLTDLRGASEEVETDADRASLATRLSNYQEKIESLVEQAKKLVGDAHKANMSALERNADGLRQSLQATHNRLNLFVNKHVPEPTKH